MFKFTAKLLVQADNLLTTSNPKTRKPYSPSLVNTDNHKTQKGEAKGWLTGIMHLAPSDLSTSSGGGNVCPNASKECRQFCLNTSGMGAMPTHQRRRIERTKLYFTDRPRFLEELRADIRKLIRQADKKNLRPAVRINGTSDLPHLARQMAQEFPDVQFYDYTKVPEPWTRTLPNYHITFSRSENNEHHALKALEHGVNVAVVFGIKKGDPLPETWHGYSVMDGDNHDLRFLDDSERPDPNKPLVIGLRAKGRGRGKGTDTGFVVNPKPEQLVQIQQQKASSLRPAKAVPKVAYFCEGVFS
jgi:hypothetical protein